MESGQAIFHGLHQMVARIIINMARISPQLELNSLSSSATTTTQQQHHLHHNYYNKSNSRINKSNFKMAQTTMTQITNMGRGAGYDTTGTPKPAGPKPAPKPTK